MSWSTAQIAIRSRFEANVSLEAERLSFDAFNGPRFETPAVSPADFEDAHWARLSLAPVPFSGVPLGVGAEAAHWRQGLIVVQLFAPRGAGDARLYLLADEVMALFDRARFSNVWCRDADEPDRVGFDDSGEWFQVNVTVPFDVLD